jgi:hypothetical protein
MRTYVRQIGAIVLIALTAGCKSYSKHTIDMQPMVKIDTSMLGIWKALEDTERGNYILVQSFDDIVRGLTGDKSDSKLIMDETGQSHYYYLTRMNGQGLNAQYVQQGAFPSRIGNATFLNVDYSHTPGNNGKEGAGGKAEEGYFFVKVEMNEARNVITTYYVNDPDLQYMSSSKEVRNMIARNMNRPSFYSNTLHFYKVSNYHASVDESMKIANKR